MEVDIKVNLTNMTSNLEAEKVMKSPKKCEQQIETNCSETLDSSHLPSETEQSETDLKTKYEAMGSETASDSSGKE